MLAAVNNQGFLYKQQRLLEAVLGDLLASHVVRRVAEAKHRVRLTADPMAVVDAGSVGRHRLEVQLAVARDVNDDGL